MTEAEKDETLAEIDAISRGAVGAILRLAARQPEGPRAGAVLVTAPSYIALEVIKAIDRCGEAAAALRCRESILAEIAGHAITSGDSRETIQ